MSKVIPVILSGGAGTRLWPLSREMYPKQLLALTSKQTMLQDTATRLSKVAGALAPIVVCNEAHRFTVAEQLRALNTKASAILLEPAGRNTAPAVALAALQAIKIDADATLIVVVDPQEDQLVVEASAACDTHDVVAPGSFSWHVLTSLADDVQTFHDGREPNETGSVFGITLTARRAASSR